VAIFPAETSTGIEFMLVMPYKGFEDNLEALEMKLEVLFTGGEFKRTEKLSDLIEQVHKIRAKTPMRKLREFKSIALLKFLSN
jgi:hypothetical protein